MPREKKNNLRTLFGVEMTPGVDQIRNMVDDIEPEKLWVAFDEALSVERDSGILENYRIYYTGGTGRHMVFFIRGDTLRSLSHDRKEEPEGRDKNAVLSRHGCGNYSETGEAGRGITA